MLVFDNLFLQINGIVVVNTNYSFQSENRGNRITTVQQ